MKFKEPHMEAQLEECHPLLKLMVGDFDKLSLEISGKEAIVTRVSDSVPGESGVHPAKRAVDFRDQFQGRPTYTVDERDYILERMNKKYRRNDGKKTLIHHSFNGGPAHFHLQISAILDVYKRT